MRIIFHHVDTIRDRLRTRRGLAPLELVLALPILLFVMALMVDFGNLACWKVRGSTVARQSVWRQRWPRRGNTDPQPIGWPSPATMDVAGASPELLPNDPFSQFPVVRGPTLNDPQSGKFFYVDLDGRLDLRNDLKNGQSHIDIRLPMLPSIAPHFSFSLNNLLLDSRWQFGNMRLPDNITRRSL